jgi:hypothetical protein
MVIRIFERRVTGSVCAATRYNLENTPNVYHVQDWILYKDFTACTGAKELSALYETQVRDYEPWLRTISPTLTFYDSEWNQKITLDFDVARKFMTFAMRDKIAGGDAETIKWFKIHEHTYDNSHLPYVFQTLCLVKKPHAAHLMLDLWENMPVRNRYLHTRDLVRAAALVDFDLVQRIRARASTQDLPKLR